MRSFAFAVLAVLALPACTLYFNGDDTGDDGGDDICAYGADQPAYPSEELRDPQTGYCQAFGGGGGGGYPCGCGGYECPETTNDAPVARPDWGSCYSECDKLDEGDCKATPGCRAAFGDNPAADGGLQFMGCWSTAPSGPIEGGDCTLLDAYSCSQHDDCSPVHVLWDSGKSAPLVPAENTFERCIAETPAPTCDGIDCGSGSHCEQQCKEACGPTGDCTSTCSAYCVPDSLCNQVDCPMGTMCVETCGGGDGMTDPNNPDSPPGCGGCHVECLPDTGNGCEIQPDEASCSAQSGCQPVYAGTDCTCYPGYCTCENLTYERCEWLPD